MSIEVSQRVWHSSDLKSSNKLLLLALAEMADKDGFCWPSIKTLANMTGTSDRQTIRAMENLRKTNELIVWNQQGQHGGRGYTNIYFVITGLADQEIAEIVQRRFALLPNEIAPVLAQKGDTFVRLCHLKRLTYETLLETRKTDTSDSLIKKRVTDLAKKGDISDSRTINKPPIKKEESKVIDLKEVVEEVVSGKPQKQYSPKQKLIFALASACRIDLELATDKVWGQLGQTAKKLEKKNCAPADVDSFGQWWYKFDWRGEQDQPPIPSQVLEAWGNYEHWLKNGQQKGQYNGKQHKTGTPKIAVSQETIDAWDAVTVGRSRDISPGPANAPPGDRHLV